MATQKCKICKRKATYLLSKEWTVYSLNDEGSDIEVGDTGDVIDVEMEEYYCDKHISEHIITIQDIVNVITWQHKKIKRI